MGHATHFLERLQRIENQDLLDRALSLYRNPQLVKHVLSRARLPDGAERAALCLGEGGGPYVVVARENGAFVTCLGEGMQPTGLPVVPRAHLDALCKESEELHRRLQLVDELEGGVERLYERLHLAGPYLAREEMLALSALLPLRGASCVHDLATTSARLLSRRGELFGVLRAPRSAFEGVRLPGLGSVDELVKRTWSMAWALGHLTILASLYQRDFLETCCASTDEVPAFNHVVNFELATFTALPGVQLRAAWAVAKLGKPLLGVVKRAYGRSDCQQPILNSLMQLAALGTRHKALRAEISKALDPVPKPGDADSLEGEALGAYFRGAYSPLLLAVMHEDESADHSQPLAPCRRLVFDLAAKAQGKLPERFERLEDVPEDLALAAAACNGAEISMSRPSPAEFANLVWIASLAARGDWTRLYFPRSFLDAVGPIPFDEREFRAVVEQFWVPKTECIREAPRPQPNERCPCGSGKKYKRCCGAA